MSVSKWAYDPDYCDGDYCVGDCDLCSKIVTMYDDALEACKKELDKAFELQRSVKHSSGIWTNDSKCSVCGNEAIMIDTDTGGVWLLTDFCPFCGADLRGTPHERA